MAICSDVPGAHSDTSTGCIEAPSGRGEAGTSPSQGDIGPRGGRAGGDEYPHDRRKFAGLEERHAARGGALRWQRALVSTG